MKERIEFIDIAKGIGIILVVIGHNFENETYPWLWIYSFHMPLFFVISGLCYSDKKYPTFKSFLYRKINTLVIPYIFFSLVQFCVFYFVLDRISLKQIVKIILYGWSPNPLWFLPVLFMVEVVYYLISKTKNGKLLWGLLILILLYRIFTNGSLIYGITVVPWFFLFYAITAYFKDRIILKKSNYIISIFILVALIWHFILLNKVIKYNINFVYDYNDFLALNIRLISSLLGSVIIIYFSQLLANFSFKNNVLIWVGKNTLVILCTHLMIKYTILTFGNSFIQQTWIWQPLVWIIMFVLIAFSNKFIPTMVGKQNLIKIRL